MSKKEKLYKDLPRPKLNRDQIAEIYRRLSIERPSPETELDYVNPYTLVVAVALSAQATDIGVNRATKDLFKIADTPEKMLALGEDVVRDGGHHWILLHGRYVCKARTPTCYACPIQDICKFPKKTPPP